MAEDDKKDILKELGLKIEFNKNTAKVYDSNNELVGSFPFNRYDQPYKNIKTITPTDSKVAEKYQGKGIASEVYKRAEEHFNAKIIPDDQQSYQGDLLHEKYGQGKKFGLSSSELDSKLTKKERIQRHSRQKALQEIMTEIAEGKYGNDVNTLSDFGGSRRDIRELSEKIRKNAPFRNLASLLQNAVSNSWDQSLKKLDLDKIKQAIPSALSRVKSVPLVGPAIGAGLAAMSGEANAASALPILGEAGDLGPQKGSADWEIENPQATPELRRKALESLMRK